MPWTQFWDMHSGGSQKLEWAQIFIEAPEAEAENIFYNRFDRNPHRVTCTCCGEDYSIHESESLAEATEFHRMDWGTKKVGRLKEYVAQPDVLVIWAHEIKPEERHADIPEEGYVWR